MLLFYHFTASPTTTPTVFRHQGSLGCKYMRHGATWCERKQGETEKCANTAGPALQPGPPQQGSAATFAPSVHTREGSVSSQLNLLIVNQHRLFRKT